MGIAPLRVSFWGLVAAVAVAAPVAGASSVTYNLNQSNSSLFPDGTTNYATVKIEDVGGGGIQFTVTPNASAFSIPPEPNNFGIQEFGFNLTSNNPPTLLSGIGGNFSLPLSYASFWKESAGGQMDGFGKFAWVLSTPVSEGGGVSRQSPLVFTITGVADDTLATYFGLSTGNNNNPPGEGAVNFAAHIAGFLDPTGATGEGAVTSAFFGGGPKVQVVPLPATAWLLLSGVAGLGALARRRRLVAA